MISAVTATALGKHLGVSRQRVSAMAADGILKELPGGLFDQDASRLAYIAWLRDARRETTRTAAASEVQKARAEQIRLRTARERNELILVDTVEATLATILATFRAELGGAPAGATRDLAARAAFERLVESAVTRLRDRFAALAANARSGVELDVDGPARGA